MTNRGVLSGLGPGDEPNVLTSDAGQNALLAAGNRKEVTFSTTTAQAVATADCSNYRSVSVHIVTQGGSSSVQPQGSNDGVNWVAVRLTEATVAGPVASNSISTAGVIFSGGLAYRYFRLNIVGIVSGTTAGTVEFFAFPPAQTVQLIYAGTGGLLVQAGAGASDGVSSILGLQAPAFPSGYIGGSTWDRLRTPNTFKTVAATASGNTALWTPTSGKKFRLMRYRLELSADAATSGGALMTLKFQDATTDMPAAHSVYVPAVSGTAFGNGYQPGWVDFGNGILSAVADRVLNVNLSAALTSGTCRVMCAGVEE